MVITWPQNLVDWMAMLANASLIFGIPISLLTFAWQERKERQNEQEEIYDKLMEHYARIQEKLFEYPELDDHDKPLFDPEAARRQLIIYEMLVSLFERAFILLSTETSPSYRRMWNSWLDYIHMWIIRPNFRAALPEMMHGEDPDFTKFMAKITGLDLKP